MHPPFSRNNNSAGAPLPLIPRRISASRSRSAPSMAPVKVVVQQSTPPLPSDSDDSSSSSSPTPVRPKRVRGIRTAVRPPEHSTPTPAVHEARLEQYRQPHSTTDDDTTPRRPPLIYTPGISLRIATEHLKTRTFSESHLRASTEPPPSAPASQSCFVTSSQSQPRLIRKKSGQLVKSSLKSSKSLSVVTARIPSKSEPTTPTHAKAVHFDAQLEHVKLFLAEQKPLAVSRDGSPTEDTSGTDTDFPSFIFGGASPDKHLLMHTPNMPPRLDVNADAALEDLRLSPDALSITGRVRVRNLAYAKSVVARFTFDAWQTTSEVSARYLASPDPEFDVFVFSVRLNDLLARIEGKRMWLAVRYVVGEREVWDNNGGRDYLAEFSVAAPPKGSSSESEDSSSNSAAAESDIADLRSKLEKVVAQPVRPPPPKRYDLSASLTQTQQQAWTPRVHAHTRTQSYPQAQAHTSYPTTTTTPTKANSIPWPEKGGLLGSPRDVGEDLFAGRRFDENVLPAPVLAGPKWERGRNHRRGGYFADTRYHQHRVGDGVRLTLSGSEGGCVGAGAGAGAEETTPVPGRFYSFPPVERAGLGFKFGLGLEGYSDSTSSTSGSELSTPSLESSRETSPSPTESCVYLTPGEGEEEEGLVSGDYKEFLSRFCFFTGSDQLPAHPPDAGSAHHSHTHHPYLARKTFIDGPPCVQPEPEMDLSYVLRSGSATPQPTSPPVPMMFGAALIEV